MSLQVALVYPNSDPGMFWVAFYGCLLAEVIPVPIEVPLTRKVKKQKTKNNNIQRNVCPFCVKRNVMFNHNDILFVLKDAGISQVGFLLGSCGVSLALTSEICLKGLPKTPTGEIMQFKGQ